MVLRSCTRRFMPQSGKTQLQRNLTRNLQSNTRDVLISKVITFSAMGAPKQKWTAVEEEALKAGVRKTGKWQTILKDPEFSHVLSSRSNVDLKDKWRNINVTASGLGSREKARLVLKRNPESKPRSVPPSGDKGQASVSKRSFTRLESVKLEETTTLNEPEGSDKKSIATYIEDTYWEPPDFKKLVSTKLKFMTSSGKLVKANHWYKLAPSSSPSQSRAESLNGKHKDVFKVDKNGVRTFTQPEVDAELNRMRSMPAHEAAAAAAARAVVEAEAALAEAEKEAREAEVAEAEAEASQIFAQIDHTNYLPN